VLKNRLPKWDQIIPVYAVIAFMMFAWAIVIALWKIPAWLYFQTILEIFAILASVFSQIFFESVLVLGILLVVCFLLPPKLLKNDFAVRGTWMSFTVIGSMMLYVDFLFQLQLPFEIWLAATLAFAILLGYASTRIGWLTKATLEISDRLIIFLYLLIPISLVSVLTALIRNIN